MQVRFLRRSFKISDSRYQIQDTQSGQVLIFTLTTLALLLVVTTVILMIATASGTQASRSVKLTQARHLADGGIDRALQQLAADLAWPGEQDVSLGPGTYSVTVTDVVPGVSTRKRITATGAVPRRQPGADQVTTEVIIAAGETGVEASFDYAALIGTGGITMENTATMTGNVVSNGPVIGNRNNAISGNVTVTGPAGLLKNFHELGIAGNVAAHTLDNVLVAGNAAGSSCTHSTISGNLTAATRTRCTVTGTWTQLAAPDPPPQPYPIPGATIDSWKATAAAGGTRGALTLSNGSTLSLGPAKIDGNLFLDNNAILTLTGVVWVTGTITLDNRAIVRLDPALYGANSGILIGDGAFHIDNNADAQGNGQVGSYLMLVILASGGGHHESAMDFHNNASSSIAYAPNGKIHFHNSVRLKSVTANQLSLSNGANLLYDAGLATITFLADPHSAGHLTIEPDSWRIVPPS